ncbi:MAG TPA: methyltransferase [Tepidisphaeraceae bacterium]|jgi:ubiquinone/menaquinone biosynthesis C-methylase UbiE
MTDANTSGQVTPERLSQMAWGYAMPLIIEAAMQLNVFDLLAGGAKTAQQVSSETGASMRGIRMVLNALTAADLLKKDGGGQYTLGPESAAFLVSTSPGFQGGIFRHISRQLLPVWMNLTEVVKTGKPPRPMNLEGPGAEFFLQFVEDIFPLSYGAAKILGQTLGLAGKPGPVRVLDLAAGSGVWGIGLAQQSPGVTVTAVDWANVLPATRRVAAKFGLADRFTFVAGDLLEAGFGTGHHIATLGHILHSEGEARSRALLKKTYEALAPGGTIAIAEFIANEQRTGPGNAMIFAVNMLVNSEEGDTFTFAEMKSWLSEAGFKYVRTLDAPGPSPLILATK